MATKVLDITTVNLACVIGGLALLCVGLYRIVPFSLFKLTSVSQWGPVWAIFGIMAVVMSFGHGAVGLRAGLDSTLQTSANFLPMILGFFATMGFGMVLAHYYRTQIEDGLIGNHGFLNAFISAFFAPSSTMFAPMIKDQWSRNPAIHAQLMYFFTVSPLLSLNILFLRQMGLGWALSLKMYVAGVVLSILTGLLLWVASPIIQILP